MDTVWGHKLIMSYFPKWKEALKKYRTEMGTKI